MERKFELTVRVTNPDGLIYLIDEMGKLEEEGMVDDYQVKSIRPAPSPRRPDITQGEFAGARVVTKTNGTAEAGSGVRKTYPNDVARRKAQGELPRRFWTRRSPEEIEKIREWVKSLNVAHFNSRTAMYRATARKFGCGVSTVDRACNGKGKYSHLEPI